LLSTHSKTFTRTSVNETATNEVLIREDTSDRLLVDFSDSRRFVGGDMEVIENENFVN